jgi:hypothetical protein
MTTRIVQKKYVHLNIFAKNQGRAAALPCPTGSFAPAHAYMYTEDMYARAICVRTYIIQYGYVSSCRSRVRYRHTHVHMQTQHIHTNMYACICIYRMYVDPCDKMPAAMYAEGSHTFCCSCLKNVTVATRIAEIVSNVTSYVQMDQIDRNRPNRPNVSGSAPRPK